MKSNITNPSDKKQKKSNLRQNKLDDKSKEKQLDSSLPANDKPNIQLVNNQKQKKNNNLTDTTKVIPPKKNDHNQKYKQEKNNQKTEQRRTFSSSQEKIRNNNRYTNKKRPKNISMEKNLNSSQDNLKSPNNIRKLEFQTSPKKKIKKDLKKEKEKEKINPLIQNFDPNLYGFNLYKHIKENLRNKDKLCKDKLTKESYYCIDCKISTCKKCLLFQNHKEHTLVPKYLYYDSDNQVFSNAFTSIDNLFTEDIDYMDNKKLKESLKNIVTENIEKLSKRLVDTKNKKLKELDKLFKNTDGCMGQLKNQKEKIKNDIKDYLKKQKDFYFIQVKDEEENMKDLNDPDYDLLGNLKKMANKDAEMNKENNDTYNSSFILSYDIVKNTEFINNEICKLLNDIKLNKEKYLNEFDENIKKLHEDIDKLNAPFNGLFNFSYLTMDFYKMVSDKLSKYNEKIDAMKRYIFDMVIRDNGFDQIDKDNKLAETTIKQRFDNILVYQLSDKDDIAKSIKGASTNKALHRLSMYFNGGLSAAKLKNVLQSLSNKHGAIYNSPDDVKLDNEILQKYFAYESYNTVHNYFRYKDPKKEEEIAEEYSDEIDLAKPIPGTNEMVLYDKKTTNLTKKIVNFDKKKHKYLYFLNGCRSVLIKDMLYIFGGVDKEKNITKMAYVYYIKTNELKVMPEMLKPHAYHSVQFLDYYKSIIVVGGENSNACEIYDLNTGSWKELPDMNIPRAHCNLYLDKFTNIVYAFFGIIGDIIDKNNYTDIIECLELKRLSNGWSVIDYQNKAEMDFKSGYTKILPLSNEMILIYGATNMRDFMKKAAVYLIPRFEIVKIDNNIFKEIKEKSKYSKVLAKILSSYL